MLTVSLAKTGAIRGLSTIVINPQSPSEIILTHKITQTSTNVEVIRFEEKPTLPIVAYRRHSPLELRLIRAPPYDIPRKKGPTFGEYALQRYPPETIQREKEIEKELRTKTLGNTANADVKESNIDITFDSFQLADSEMEKLNMISSTENKSENNTFDVLHSPQGFYKPYIWPSALTNFSTEELLHLSSDQSPETPAGPNLEKVAFNLTNDLLNLFLRRQNWRMYHPNLIFEDNIRGKIIEGLDAYIRTMNLVRIIAHIRFVYVRFHILKITKHPENGTIKIRWRIAGLGPGRMLLRYFPDQLWLNGQMDRTAPSWYDGLSTFHVNNDDIIFKHVVDRVTRDEDPVLETIAEKLKKTLKPVVAPSPI